MREWMGRGGGGGGAEVEAGWAKLKETGLEKDRPRYGGGSGSLIPRADSSGGSGGSLDMSVA